MRSLIILLCGFLVVSSGKESCDADTSSMLQTLTQKRKTQSIVTAKDSSAATVADVDRSPSEQKDVDMDRDLEFGLSPDAAQATFVKREGKLFEFTDNDISSFASAHLVYSKWTAVDVESQSEQIAMSMGLDASSKFGLASFSASISADTASSFTTKKRTVRFEENTKNQMKCEGLMSKATKNKLHHAAVLAFQNDDLESIYVTYGAFWADEICFGALLRTTVQREVQQNEDMSEIALRASADMEVLRSKAAAQVSGATSTQNDQIYGTTETKLTVSGGNTNLWFANDGGNSEDIIEEWKHTVSTNIVPVHYTLRPLSELIKLVNENKASAFDDYCLDRWRKESDIAKRAEDDKLRAAMGGIHRVQQKNTGNYLDAFDEVGAFDNSAVTRKQQHNPSQYWNFIYLRKHGDVTYYRIQQLGDNMANRLDPPRYLDAHLTSEHDFDVVTRPKQEDLSQEWALTPEISGNMEFRIEHGPNRQYLDAHNGAQDNRVVTRSSHQSDGSQIWVLTHLDEFESGQAAWLMQSL